MSSRRSFGCGTLCGRELSRQLEPTALAGVAQMDNATRLSCGRRTDS